MPTDCVTVFKQTYDRSIASGLPSNAATAAAQSAMDACLAQQNSRQATVAQPLTVVESGRTPDKGPVQDPRRS